MGEIEPKSDKNDPPPPPSVYTILSEREKVFTLLIATSVNFLGPASANIYFPALGEMAKDLNVSDSQINLTITSYMVRGSSELDRHSF